MARHITPQYLGEVLRSLPDKTPKIIQQLRAKREASGELYPPMTKPERSAAITELKRQADAAQALEKKLLRLQPAPITVSNQIDIESYCL